jgi:peptidoglycan lytic transglycosylase
VTRRVAALGVLLVGVVVALVVLQNPKAPDFVQRLRYPLKYRQIVRGHARNYDLDPALLAAVIYQESKFDPEAKSESGAIGLMQLLPSTAHGIALHTGGSRFRTEDLLNPEINVRYGAFYLRRLLNKYGDEQTALAAYNAGQRRVDEWRAAGKGIAFAETRNYVERVDELKRIYRDTWASELGYSSESARRIRAAPV